MNVILSYLEYDEYLVITFDNKSILKSEFVQNFDNDSNNTLNKSNVIN